MEWKNSRYIWKNSIFFVKILLTLFFISCIIEERGGEMEHGNYCRFIGKQHSNEDVYVLHFVLETKEQRFDGWKSLSFYRICYVSEGEGVYRTQHGEYRLKKGDVFFGIPGMLYAVQSVKDFQYYYIAYLGKRPLKIMEQLKINARRCVFYDCLALQPLFETGISLSDETLATGAEGLLLYAFSFLGTQYISELGKQREGHSAELIRKYVDDNFTDPELSLEQVAKRFSYHTKYVSAIFKKQFGITFKRYVNTLRVQNACALMEKGFIGIQNVAFLSGFNDPLYFSKVFKEQMGISPTEHMKEQKMQKEG